MSRRVVITGCGVVTSLGCHAGDLWDRVAAGQSGIHEVRLIKISDLKVKIGGEVSDWDPSEYMDSRERKRVDRFSQFALVAGTDAANDSGFSVPVSWWNGSATR